MKTKLLLIALLLCLGACDSTTFDNAMRRAVREKLKDPDSAKWGESYVYKNRACLEVNSKNSFGGYAGKQVAWLRTFDSGASWYVNKIEEAECFEAPVKKLAENDEAEKVAEEKVLEILKSKAYKITAQELSMLDKNSPSTDKCLLQAQDALTSKRLAIQANEVEKFAWEMEYENKIKLVISGDCKS
ncbi:hypothetical protein [Undibacterium sp. Tian12W]|uniref:hypothetical protein n=1 Tax=Undibacterium sp. Tian12W TaxID=3413054 RepID=UPI003BEF7D9C